MATITISVAPATVTVVVGKTLTLTATASSSAPSPALTYKWYKGIVSIATEIAGATSTVFTKPQVVDADAGTYIVVATQLGTGPGGTNATGQAVSTVTIGDALAVTAPASTTAKKGATATFKVTASGGITPYTYSWTKNGTAIPDTDAASYTTPATTSADNAATYTCTVTDTDSPASTVTSTAATLTVKSSIPWWVWALIAAAVVVAIIIIIVIILVVTSSNAKKRKAAEEAASNAQAAQPVAQQAAYPPLNPALAARGGSRPYGM